jgi:hypothetical protein
MTAYTRYLLAGQAMTVHVHNLRAPAAVAARCRGRSCLGPEQRFPTLRPSARGQGDLLLCKGQPV